MNFLKFHFICYSSTYACDSVSEIMCDDIRIKRNVKENDSCIANTDAYRVAKL